MLPRATENRESDIDHDALRAIGIEYDDVRHVVNETFGEGALESAPDRRGRPVTSRRPPFSTEAKHSLELSFRVALELHDKRIRPGHVLLGLLRLNDEFISRVIEQNEISVANLSAAVLLQLNA
jgi:ATP-dependent Clp protease ATP-binding subunit ClpA